MFNSEDGSLVLCGARSKRNAGAPCRQPAMKNGRCRLHGGKCKGPTTKEGLKKAMKARWKHGYYSELVTQERANVRWLMGVSSDIIRMSLAGC